MLNPDGQDSFVVYVWFGEKVQIYIHVVVSFGDMCN